VAVINETMARKYWPHDNPLGQRFREGMPNQNRPWRTVVGIVADTKEYGFKTPERLDVYVPYFELADLVVRTASDPLALAPAVRRRIQNLDKNLAVYDIKTMEQRLSEWLSTQRGAAILLGAFATLALALAMVGIYGVVAHSASQRRQEVGIRLALGARPGDVSRLVLREGMWPVLIGLGVGIAAAGGAARGLSSLLFGVAPTDLVTFGSAALLLAAVALAACYLPARRVSRVDPMEALRYE
jgi:putative ABC transport system permease protein